MGMDAGDAKKILGERIERLTQAAFYALRAIEDMDRERLDIARENLRDAIVRYGVVLTGMPDDLRNATKHLPACSKKCVFDMTGDEILAEHIAITKPARSILIVDKGNGWDVTMFGPESAGLPSTCATIAKVAELVEEYCVNLRRQKAIPRGEVITDPARIIEELEATGLFKVEREQQCSHWPGQTRCEVCGMGMKK
jgi:hypothetical protein